MKRNINVDQTVDTVENASITISVKQLIVVLGVVMSSLTGVYVKLKADIDGSKESVETTVSSSKTELKSEINRLDDQNREDYKSLDTKIQSLIQLHMNTNSVPTQPAPATSTDAPPN